MFGWEYVTFRIDVPFELIIERMSLKNNKSSFSDLANGFGYDFDILFSLKRSLFRKYLLSGIMNAAWFSFPIIDSKSF